MFRTSTATGTLALLGGILAVAAMPSTATAQCYGGAYQVGGHGGGYQRHSPGYAQPASYCTVVRTAYVDRPVYAQPTRVVRRARYYSEPVRRRSAVYGSRSSRHGSSYWSSRGSRHGHSRSYSRDHGRRNYRSSGRHHRSRSRSRGVSIGFRW